MSTHHDDPTSYAKRLQAKRQRDRTRSTLASPASTRSLTRCRGR